MKTTLITLLLFANAVLRASDFPTAEITNGEIRAQIYLPDAKGGFYRATRFDWSGVIYSLRYAGHEYYGRWFQRTDPAVHDFVYQGADIAASPCTSITGPVDEFAPVGWDEAEAGGVFLKIGVGLLRRPDDGKYDNYRLYDIADSGKWTVKTDRQSIEFTQDVGAAAGYGYRYRKTLRLADGKPAMVLQHSLQNTGTKAIHTRVYNHNFLVLDGQAPGQGLVITVPFPIRTTRPPDKRLAEVRGNQIVYLRKLEGQDIVATPIGGFGANPKDHDIRIENARLGAGMRITGSRPLASESLWSTRAVMAMEPFVSIAVDPGQEFTWTSTYDYYTLPAKAK